MFWFLVWFVGVVFFFGGCHLNITIFMNVFICQLNEVQDRKRTVILLQLYRILTFN